MGKKVLSARYIVVNSKNIIENGYILIENDKIEGVYKEWDPKFDNVELFKFPNHVIMPGFIDAHLHSYQVGNRGKNVEKDLLDWLNTHILPWESKLTPEKASLSASIAYLEMIKSGTTTFSDYTSVNHTEEAFKVALKSGLRGYLGKVMMDFNSPKGLEQKTDIAIEESIKLIEKWHNRDDGRLKYVLTPRFDVTCTPELFIKTKEISDKYNILVQTHTQETKGELEFEMKNYGKHAIEHLNDLGVLDEKMILAHCVWVTDKDLEIIKNSKSKVVHNPGSNMLLNSGIAPIPKMLEMGIDVSLGSDVVAYHSFNLLEQAKLVYNIHILNSGFGAIDGKDVFDMLTIGGAKSLNIEDEVGTLEAGKKGDIAIMKLDIFHHPINNLIENIILTGNRGDIVATMVNGKFLYKDGVFYTLDYEDILKRAETLIK